MSNVMDNIKITKEDIDQAEKLLNDIKIPEVITTDGNNTKIIRTRDWDDKDLVIIAVTIIGVASLIVIPDPAMILTSIISGLFGVAVGRK